MLERAGAFKKHPERKRARSQEPQPQPGLGNPPEEWAGESWAGERGRWADLVRMCAPGVLTMQDYGAAEQLCLLWAKLRRREIKVAESRLLASLFDKFGMNPSSRSRVRVGEPDPKKKGNGFQVLGVG